MIVHVILVVSNRKKLLCNPEKKKTLKQTCIMREAFIIQLELQRTGARPCVISMLDFSQHMVGEPCSPDPIDCSSRLYMVVKT